MSNTFLSKEVKSQKFIEPNLETEQLAAATVAKAAPQSVDLGAD